VIPKWLHPDPPPILGIPRKVTPLDDAEKQAEKARRIENGLKGGLRSAEFLRKMNAERLRKNMAKAGFKTVEAYRKAKKAAFDKRYRERKKQCSMTPRKTRTGSGQ